MKRFIYFLKRIINGEDIVLVPQTVEIWERQFADGTWDRLKEGQPNTIELAHLISDYANTKSERVRVLDVGCGNGGLARLLSKKSGIEYTGIDISETAISAARKVAPDGTFIVGDAMNPNKNLGVFDILVFNEVLYYLDPRIVLPLYRTYANSSSQIYISIVHFWRSWFVWKRIRSILCIEKSIIVRHPVSEQCWDIATGYFKRTHSDIVVYCPRCL